MAVGTHEDAGQDDLHMAGIDEILSFGHGVGGRFAPERGSQLRDDAVGAVGVAAVLDFQESALMTGLAVGELGEGRGARLLSPLPRYSGGEG